MLINIAKSPCLTWNFGICQERTWRRFTHKSSAISEDLRFFCRINTLRPSASGRFILRIIVTPLKLQKIYVAELFSSDKSCFLRIIFLDSCATNLLSFKTAGPFTYFFFPTALGLKTYKLEGKVSQNGQESRISLRI